MKKIIATLLIVAGAIYLACIFGCERGPSKNHFTVIDKWDDEKILIYTVDGKAMSDRLRVQVDKEVFELTRVGDRIDRDGDKLTITRPAVEIVE